MPPWYSRPGFFQHNSAGNSLGAKNSVAAAAPAQRPKGRHSVQVIARAADVLRALEGESNGLSLGQIAQRVGLARSTVQRIVEALSEEHFLIAASPTAGVRLGPALIRLGASAHVEFDQITRPLLMELSQKVGETVDLSVLKGTVAVFTDQVQGVHRLRAVSAVGETFPLHCSANGKALLSVLDEQKLDKLLRGPLPRLTANTIVQRTDLIKAIESVRRNGVAYDLEEHTDGICAVGTAFLDPIGRAVAISIPVPTTRFRNKRLKALLTDEILQTRTQMTESLGSSAGQAADGPQP
jgi:DNA-binding IclR family transcriptional regulator